MKKITTLLVVFFLVLTLSACSNNNEKPLSPNDVINKTNNKESFVMVASSTTCGYCKDFKVEVKEFKNQNSDADIVFVEIDSISSYQERVDFVDLFAVNSTPTSYFFKKGKLVKTEEGVIPSADLAEMYQEYIIGN